MSADAFVPWIGRKIMQRDDATAAPLRALAALFDRDAETRGLLPPLAHWLYFNPHARQSELGADGHPRLGGALPDLGLPRRMWAGSCVEFHAPIAIGAAIARTTTIDAVTLKRGASGDLGFVTLRHEITVGDTLAITEVQDLVYRAAATAPFVRPNDPPAAPVPAAHRRRRRFGPVDLFRFSAMTFNAHRIHYDRDYSRGVEMYPGLVVHGPLQAMCLLDLARERFPAKSVARFAFRAQAPLFEDEMAIFAVEPDSAGASLWVQPEGHGVSMTAAVEWATD